MEDSDEFRWALKVVIKRQMRDLLQQLHDVGEEMAVLSVNVSEGTASHFGTSQGEWFLSEQKNIKQNFLKYCQTMSRKSGGKPNLGPLLEDLNATIESCHEEKLDPETSSSRKGKLEQKLSAARDKKSRQVFVSSKKPSKAVIKIKVPKGMITSGTSDSDLSGLVGRLLNQELKAQKSKSDAAEESTQNKFSTLLEAANIAKEQVQKTLGKRPGSGDTQSVAKRTRRSGPTESPAKAGGDTPGRSLRSGRAVSSKFLEGVASLKPKTLKGKESETDEHSDMEQSESIHLEGSELETVSAQLSKELEQMTLPVLEKIEEAALEGESFDNREIQGMSEQRKALIGTTYVVRGPQGDEDGSDIEISVAVPAEDNETEGLNQAEIESLTEEIVNKVKNSETQTPKADHDYIDDAVNYYDEENNLIDLENFPQATEAILHHRRTFKQQNADSIGSKSVKKQKQFYACRFCDKLFGRKIDCQRHEERNEKTQFCKEGKDSGLVEISAVESHSGKLEIYEKEIKIAEELDKINAVEENATEVKGMCVVDIPMNTTQPSVKGIFHCPKCNKKFKGSSNFYSHNRAVHENYRPFSCEVCKRQFSTQTNFSNHQIAVHTRKCDGCGHYVAETEPWGEGMMKFTERNVLCGNCNKVVVFFSGNKTIPVGMGVMKSAITPFKRRKRTPKDNKQTYACEICDKLFNHLSDCRRHQQKHADGNYNMCDICGRQFKHATSLQQHQKIHDESYVPFHCSICDKMFELKHSWKEHMTRKHGIIPEDDKPKSDDVEGDTQYIVAGNTVVDDFGNVLL